MNAFTAVRGLRWLAIAGVFLLLAPRAFASVEINGGAGDVDVSTLLCTADNSDCLNNPDCREDLRTNLEAPFPGNPDVPPTGSLNVPQCAANGSSVGPVDVQGTFAGDAQSMTFTANGSGNGHVDSSNPPADLGLFAESAGFIQFTVTGEPTDVPISVSMTAINCDTAKATLERVGGDLIGEITADNDGQHGSFPSDPLSPGIYNIELQFAVIFPQSSEVDRNFNFSGTITVNAPPCGVSRHIGANGQEVVTVNQCGVIEWNNAAGGSFATATNWDPQTVPGPTDTAIFGLLGLYSVDVGTATTDRLEIRNGGVTFTNANYTVTAGGSAPPSILLDDNALLVMASGSLSGVQGVIGQSGAAALEVQSGATLSLITLSVGGAGVGSLNIAAGGSVFSGETLIGNGAGSANVNLSGANAFLDSGNLVIGSGGLLFVSAGASLTSGLGNVGTGLDMSGLVFIHDAGSKWTLDDELVIQEGIVSVQDGGLLDAHQSIDIGTVSTQAGQLEMLGGGLVQTPNCTVWSGLVDVVGQGTASSRLDVTDLLSLGGLLDPASTSTSSVEVEITGGAVVVAQRFALGDREGISNALATISGVGGNGQASLLNVAGASPSFLVSGAPGTLLEVKDGGMLSTGSSLGGDSIGSGSLVGKVLIGGKTGSQPSIWSVGSVSLSIGSQVVPSELTVEEGGVVTSEFFIFLGTSSRELGKMTISGEDSSLTADRIILGPDGDGTLAITGGGAIDTTDEARVGSDPGAAGGNGRGTELVTIQGTLFSSSEWHVTSTCKIGVLEPSTLRLEGETIGPFDVGGATLRADGTVTVGPKGFVRGNGTIVSPKVVGTNIDPDVDIEAPVRGNAVLTAATAGKSSLLSAGAAGGIIRIEGDYEQPADGKLTIDTVGVADGEFDVLHVTGNATLAGTLEMLFPGTYLPKTGDSWKFLRVDGTISGEFAEVTFPQLAAGFQFGTMQVAGGLLFTALNDAVLAPTFLLNISTRLQVGTDDNVLIGGFILTGTEPKKVLIRAVGPSLEAAGISGALADPTLELHDSTGALIGQNDNWRETQIGGVITDDQFFDIFATGISPVSLEESAIVATLDPGAYTAIVAGADGTTGIGLAEVYDLGPAAAPAKLANISTRGFVQTGDNVMIGGFIVGNQTSQVLMRGIGPSLAGAGIGNALADSMLDLHDGNGALLASNDNWRSDQETEIEATTLQPNDDAEAPILRTLAPGAYTAILRGVSDATGVGLVEAYNLD